MFGIIVNPVSGGGKHRKIAHEIGVLLEKRGQEWRVYETQCEGDGTNEAQRAIDDGCSAVVCVGGDGTLSEVVQAVAGSGRTLYLVPCGTGNDFARALGLKHDPLAAFISQLDGEETRVDCGCVNGKAFANISGSGFDVEVLRKTEELKAVYPGGKAYRKAVMAVLGSYRAFQADVVLDGGETLSKRFTIVEIANGRYFGGGMLVAPKASYTDGTFDVVMIDCVAPWFIPFLLPLFILGVHIYIPIVRVVRAKEIVLRSRGMVLNIDGRLELMDEARYSIMPGALRMRLPARK